MSNWSFHRGADNIKEWIKDKFKSQFTTLPSLCLKCTMIFYLVLCAVFLLK